MQFFLKIILCFIFSALINFQVVYADSMKDLNQMNKNISENNEISKKDDQSMIKKTNSDDIFGDEQTFPFVAGLGKNAAH